MSATQRSISALALLLGLVIASAAQVSSPQPPDRGIMPYPNYWWSLTVINLTTHDLAPVASVLDPSTCESAPFHGKLDGGDPFPLPPYRTVTWKGNDYQDIFCPTPHVSGYIDFLPLGMEPKWTVRLNFLGQGATGWDFQQVYLTADLSNPGWNVAPFSCSYPGDYNSKYNVMTLSGTDLLVTLYTPIIYQVKPSPTAMITLVIRERWPHTQLPSGYDESLVMPCLTFTNIQVY